MSCFSKKRPGDGPRYLRPESKTSSIRSMSLILLGTECLTNNGELGLEILRTKSCLSVQFDPILGVSQEDRIMAPEASGISVNLTHSISCTLPMPRYWVWVDISNLITKGSGWGHPNLGG